MSEIVGGAGVGAGAGASREAAMDAAERTLAQVKRLAPGAEAEINVQLGVSALTRFANSRIHQNMDGRVSRVALRLAIDGRVASASLDGPLADDALATLVAGVAESARVLPLDPDWPGLTPPSPVLKVDHWDEATAAATPADRAARVAAFVVAAGGLEAAGFCETEATHHAFLNSAGQALTSRTTSAVLDGVARTGTSDGSGRCASISLETLDGAAAGRTAAFKARTTATAVDIEPGDYAVILEPSAVADVLSFLAVYAFNGKAVEEGTSFLRPGTHQFDDHLTLWEDTEDPILPGVPFDAEGTPRQPIELIHRGVAGGPLHSRRTAGRVGEGTVSTGHAASSPWFTGALPSAMVLAPGGRSERELIARVPRGLLVTDFFYTRVLDPRTLVVTGLTRNGVWLIENGLVTQAVRNLRFTQSYAEALGPGRVQGISVDRHVVPDTWGGFAYLPRLHLASWHFTGGARG